MEYRIGGGMRQFGATTYVVPFISVAALTRDILFASTIWIVEVRHSLDIIIILVFRYIQLN